MPTTFQRYDGMWHPRMSVVSTLDVCRRHFLNQCLQLFLSVSFRHVFCGPFPVQNWDQAARFRGRSDPNYLRNLAAWRLMARYLLVVWICEAFRRLVAM